LATNWLNGKRDSLVADSFVVDKAAADRAVVAGIAAADSLVVDIVVAEDTVAVVEGSLVADKVVVGNRLGAADSLEVVGNLAVVVGLHLHFG
jgi:hypothetical protein